MFVCMLRVTFRGGSVVAVPTVSFSAKEDAENFNKERMAFLTAVANGMAALPSGRDHVEMPLPQVLGELGLLNIGVGVDTVEVRNSGLVVPKPQILLAH